MILDEFGGLLESTKRRFELLTNMMKIISSDTKGCHAALAHAYYDRNTKLHDLVYESN
jgi:hypothetical protein